ncbi:MAG: hypothetical protein JNN04_14100 [Cyclobacteriaceae bacterium]|nr:hypothetical protein [Cyclobacteriaceae bacterium]
MASLRFILLCIVLLSPALVRAQSMEDLDELAQATCNCISSKKIDMSNRNELQAQLGICMLESAGAMNMKFDGWSTDEFRQFGEKVGLRMATKCPSVFESFAKSAIEEKSENSEVSGKIKSVKLTDPTTVVLREEEGKEHSLLWIDYFGGSDDYAGNPESLVNRSVVIEYRLSEIYSAKSKGYITSKVITKLTVKP